MSKSTSSKLSNLTVVVRSSYERTEALCVHLVKQQVDEANIVVIHERPFSQAVRRGFEIGIDYDKEWTLCVDADLLVATGKIAWLVENMANQSTSALGGHGRILDKMYGKLKYGGPHLYRTAYLPEALRHIPNASVDLRPETYVKDRMFSLGHEWIQLQEVIAIHDYEQFYSDIYRTMIVRANKSQEAVSVLLHRAELLAPKDWDFLVCAWALRIALSRDDAIQLDSEQWREEAALLLVAHGIEEKIALSLAENIGLPDQILKEYRNSQAIRRLLAQPSRAIQKLRSLNSSASPKPRTANH